MNLKDTPDKSNVSREELLKLKEQFEAQLAWVNEKLSSLPTPSITTETKELESQPQEPALPSISSLPKTSPLEHSPDLDQTMEDSILSAEKSSGFNRMGCILIAIFSILLFLASFWLLPQLLY